MKRKYISPASAVVRIAADSALLAASGEKDWAISDKEVDEQGSKQSGDLVESDIWND